MTITVVTGKENRIFLNSFYKNFQNENSIEKIVYGVTLFFIVVTFLAILNNLDKEIIVFLSAISIMLVMLNGLINRKNLHPLEETQNILIDGVRGYIKVDDSEILLEKTITTYNIYEQKYKRDLNYRVGVLKFDSDTRDIVFRMEGKQCKELTEYLINELKLGVNYDNTLRI